MFLLSSNFIKYNITCLKLSWELQASVFRIGESKKSWKEKETVEEKIIYMLAYFALEHKMIWS